MRSEKKGRQPVPLNAQPPSNNALPPLRKEDVTKNEGLRGLVVRGGAGAVPSVWED